MLRPGWIWIFSLLNVYRVDNKPHFETERLLLKPRTLADFDASYAMDLQPGVLDHIPGPWHDPQAHKAFIRQRIEQHYGDGLGYWSIMHQDAPADFLGWVLLIPEDAIGPDIEIGWRLQTHAWGRGYATEAARALLHHAFVSLTLSRVIADIAPANQASKAVARKIGLRPGEQAGAGYQRFELSGHDYFAQ